MRLLTGALRFAAGLLYTSFAWAYDLVAWSVSAGQWRSWQSAGLEALPTGPVLELGHGPGHLLEARAQQGLPAFGLDASPQMTRQALRRLRRAGVQPRLIRARAQRLPIARERFDAVLSTFPSEYILDPDTLSETWRVLKPGGVWVILPMARIAGKSTLDRLTARLAHLTGEDREPPAEWGRAFEPFGFTLRSEWVRQPRGLVLRMVARKPASPAAKGAQ